MAKVTKKTTKMCIRDRADWDAGEFYHQLGIRYRTHDGNQVEKFLTDCARQLEGDGADRTMRCMVYNELGSFYRGTSRYQELSLIHICLYRFVLLCRRYGLLLGEAVQVRGRCRAPHGLPQSFLAISLKEYFSSIIPGNDGFTRLYRKYFRKIFRISRRKSPASQRIGWWDLLCL